MIRGKWKRYAYPLACIATLALMAVLAYWMDATQ